MSAHLPDCTINLTNVGKYMDIDEHIIGIKYNCGHLVVMKGKYSTTIYKKSKIKVEDKIKKRLFYNQVTIIVNNKGNHVNVKLFANGSLHLTGCKQTSEGEEVVRLIYKKLDSMRDKKYTILITKDINGVLLDKDNIIYSCTSIQTIGFVQKVGTSIIYNINKKDYEIDKKTSQFITKRVESQRKRDIINFDGVQIGHCKLELLKNKKKLYKNNSNIFFDYENSLIYYDNDTIIGNLVYDYDKTKLVTTSSLQDVFEIEYNCCPFKNNEYKLDKTCNLEIDINCINVYFNINYQINRQRFYEKLYESNFICKYNPESYSGIKLTYKLPMFSTLQNFGHCLCTQKCTCTNITFLIFQSGNVIATGFRQSAHIDIVCKHFHEICETSKELIKSKN